MWKVHIALTPSQDITLSALQHFGYMIDPGTIYVDYNSLYERLLIQDSSFEIIFGKVV